MERKKGKGRRRKERNGQKRAIRTKRGGLAWREEGWPGDRKGGGERLSAASGEKKKGGKIDRGNGGRKRNDGEEDDWREGKKGERKRRPTAAGWPGKKKRGHRGDRGRGDAAAEKEWGERGWRLMLQRRGREKRVKN
ncbi:uncharacterized protein [Solanum lycopersicum]|uniref:uncharacterized protein n=1 Tax=Solanum lycopersicum TaxID=4081 RepID=UPI003747DDF7